MYFPDLFVGGGHSSTGVTAPSATWLFAEGFTGSIGADNFDTYLLVANPNASPTSATVTFFTDAGQTYIKRYSLLAEERLSIYANELTCEEAPGVDIVNCTPPPA